MRSRCPKTPRSGWVDLPSSSGRQSPTQKPARRSPHPGRGWSRRPTPPGVPSSATRTTGVKNGWGALGMRLRVALASVRDESPEAEDLLSAAIEELNEATTELRELARGIHPAVL